MVGHTRFEIVAHVFLPISSASSRLLRRPRGVPLRSPLLSPVLRLRFPLLILQLAGSPSFEAAQNTRQGQPFAALAATVQLCGLATQEHDTRTAGAQQPREPLRCMSLTCAVSSAEDMVLGFVSRFSSKSVRRLAHVSAGAGQRDGSCQVNGSPSHRILAATAAPCFIRLRRGRWLRLGGGLRGSVSASAHRLCMRPAAVRRRALRAACGWFQDTVGWLCRRASEGKVDFHGSECSGRSCVAHCLCQC